MAEQAKATAKIGGGNSPSMAAPAQSGSSGRVAGSPSLAPKPPPKRKGGRRRSDGLPSGSAEAEAADRERDRLRKEAERALVDPPPLPATAPSNGDQAGPAPGDPNAGDGNRETLPRVPIEPKEFLPWINKAFDGAEQNRMAKREYIAREAGFSEPTVRKFVSDARYDGASKASLADSAAEGMAWGANKLKMSRGAVKGSLGLVALVAFFFENRRSDAEFAKAVSEFRKGKEPGRP